MKRSYDGPALDHTYQYITERPALEKASETVYATDPEPAGEERTENVPVPDGGPSVPADATGQTTLDDWSRSP